MERRVLIEFIPNVPSTAAPDHRGRARMMNVRAYSSADKLEVGETRKPRAITTLELYRGGS